MTFCGHGPVGIGGVTECEEPLLAEPAGAAGNDEWHHDAIPYPQVCNAGPHLHDFSPRLMAEHVSFLHARHDAVVEMKIGATNGSRCDADNDIAWILDFRIRDSLDLHVFLALPD
jgi:hypothetical protein